MKNLQEKYGLLAKYVRDSGGIFICPDTDSKAEGDDLVMQVNEEGQFVTVAADSIEVGLDSIRGNHRAFCGILRRGCEVNHFHEKINLIFY